MDKVMEKKAKYTPKVMYTFYYHTELKVVFGLLLTSMINPNF